MLRIAKELFIIHTHRKRLLFGLALIFFKTFSGVQAVNYYSPIIFEQLGFEGAKNSLFATGMTFVVALALGPGGSRVRSPLARVVHPLASGLGTWLVSLLVVGTVAASFGR